MKIDIDDETIVITVDVTKARLTISEVDHLVGRLRAARSEVESARWIREKRERREAENARASQEHPDGWLSNDERGQPRWVAICDGFIHGMTSHFSITVTDLLMCPRRLLVRQYSGRVAHIVHPYKGVLCNQRLVANEIAPDGMKVCAACARREGVHEGVREAGPLFGKRA